VKKYFPYLLFAFLGFAHLPAKAQDTVLSEKNYKIYSVKEGTEVSLKDIVNDTKNYDVVFYGEEHDDSVTHFLEKSLLMALYEKYNSVITLSMEMFERDIQGVMDEYLMGAIREKYFKKDARSWSNYKDYRPLIEFAKANHLDVVCANAPGRYPSIAGTRGEKALEALPDWSKKNIAPLPYDTATGAYYEKLQAESGHMAPPPHSKNDTSKSASGGPAMMMPAFDLVVAQSCWDATMAYSISEYMKAHAGKKVMQVNGRFHSDEGFAVVTQLKKYNPKAKILIISTGSEESFPNVDWSKLKQNGDYIIATDPKVPKTIKDKIN
jgi:uncharacterized iron-regulated protein